MPKITNSNPKRPSSITDLKGYQLYFRKVCDRSKERYEASNPKNPEKVDFEKSYYGFEPYFYRAIYRFTREFLCQKYSLESLETIAHNEGFKFDQRSVENPFNLALALFAEPAGINMSRSKRGRLSKAMAYAFEHDIEPYWLLGFLHQAGGHIQAAKKYERLQSKAKTCQQFEDLRNHLELWYMKSPTNEKTVRREHSLINKIFEKAKEQKQGKFTRE